MATSDGDVVGAEVWSSVESDRWAGVASGGDGCDVVCCPRIELARASSVTNSRHRNRATDRIKAAAFQRLLGAAPPLEEACTNAFVT